MERKIHKIYTGNLHFSLRNKTDVCVQSRIDFGITYKSQIMDFIL